MLKKVSFLLILLLFPFQLFSAPKNPVSSVKKLVGNIRYKKNDKAIALIDIKSFCKNLLPGDYEKLSDGDKKKFEDAMKEYIQARSFPVALKYFDKIDINYEKPKKKGNETELPSSIMYKGSEKIQFSWILTNSSEGYLISDFLIKGKLATETNRPKIESAYKKKGLDGLVQLIKKASK
ncbi:MAG: ABC transporter substrate-binding protein [Leptospiraceae bacterium]|nr:ABC transporter substrate-binding protein [Leptospiraceae bacterium]